MTSVTERSLRLRYTATAVVQSARTGEMEQLSRWKASKGILLDNRVLSSQKKMGKRKPYHCDKTLVGIVKTDEAGCDRLFYPDSSFTSHPAAGETDWK